MNIERLTDLASALDTARNSPDGVRVTIDKTPWLSDVDLEDVQEFYGQFEELFQEHLDSCVEKLGPASYTDSDDRERVNGWYPEALRLAFWQRGDGNIFLALVHHDQETPIYIEVGSITQEEIDQLLE